MPAAPWVRSCFIPTDGSAKRYSSCSPSFENCVYSLGNLRRESANDTAQFGELGGRRIDGGDSRWPGSSGRTPALRTLWTQAACTVLGRPRHPCHIPVQWRLRCWRAVLHRLRRQLGRPVDRTRTIKGDRAIGGGSQ